MQFKLNFKKKVEIIVIAMKATTLSSVNRMSLVLLKNNWSRAKERGIPLPEFPNVKLHEQLEDPEEELQAVRKDSEKLRALGNQFVELTR
jgi:hypothetical protein